jgi:hypothetical protein
MKQLRNKAGEQKTLASPLRMVGRRSYAAHVVPTLG